MHRICKNKNEKGFTLIELMIVVAIIGILAAVAIPQFLDMMKSSKRSEAEMNLDAIKKGVKAELSNRAGFIAGTADETPGESCCDSDRADRKCEPDSELWVGDATWDALNFNVDEAHYFRYAYTGTVTEFSATAVGDLDCDTEEVTYELTGDYNNGNPQYALVRPSRPD